MVRGDTIYLKNRKGANGEPLKLSYVPEKPDIEIQYPVEWFTKNPIIKPPLIIPFQENVDIVKMGQHVHTLLGTENLKLEHALCCLGAYCQVFLRAKLDEDWVSFGRVIGKKGQEITPLDLVQFSGTDYVYPIASVDCDPKILTGLAMYLLMVGRYHTSQNNVPYRQTFDRNFGNQLKAAGINKSVTQMGAAYVGWCSDRQYQVLCAAIDMFLFRFNTHENSCLRMGTIFLRDKDGVARTAFNNFLLLKKLTFMEFCRCIYVSDIIEEVIRVVKEGQEMELPHSYAHYSMAMHLSSKSPYSSQVNPNLHFFIHTIGCYASETRSKNARLLAAGCHGSVRANAALVAKFILKGTGMQSQVGAVDDDGEMVNDSEDEQVDDTYNEDENVGIDNNPKEPKSRDGYEWFVWLKSCRSYPHPPDYILREANESFSRLEDTREGSIGRYLQETAVKALHTSGR
jgi:Rhabdovirus nucleocapsid protein